MPLILSQERTVGIEVTMDDRYTNVSYVMRYKYEDHMANAPRLPILGTVPDHWKEGEVIPIGEYEIKDIDRQDQYADGTWPRSYTITKSIIPTK